MFILQRRKSEKGRGVEGEREQKEEEKEKEEEEQKVDQDWRGKGKNLMTSHSPKNGILGEWPGLGREKTPRWLQRSKNSLADSSQKNVTAGSEKQLE